MSYTKPSISNYNASPPPDDASQISANVIRWSNHITKIGDPLKSYIDAVNNATESAWNDLASTSTTSDGAALLGYKHGGSTGTFSTGATARTVQAKLDEIINVSDFGVVGDGSDESTEMQAAIDYAVSRVLAGKYVKLVCDYNVSIASQLTVAVSAVDSGRIPDIEFNGRITYSGSTSQPAIIIGEDNEVFFFAEIKIDLVRSTSSDWSDSAEVGVKIINANTSNINIRRSRYFTTGVEFAGVGSGFSYNNVILGFLFDNKYAVALTASAGSGTGWCNENVYIGGRVGTTNGLNTTLTRYGVRMVNNSDSINNNVFIKPSWEYNYPSAVGADKTYGIITAGSNPDNITRNHFLDVRNEGTQYVADWSAGGSENLVEVGYASTANFGVVASPNASNVHLQSRVRNQYHSNSIVFDAPNLRDLTMVDGAGTPLAIVSGMHFMSTSAGVADSAASVTMNANSITVANTDRYLGVKIDTSITKNFLVVPGFYNGGVGRIGVVCFDSGGSVINTGSPVVGSVDRTFSLLTSMYRTSGSNAATTMQFSDSVKSAFIGVAYDGTNTCELNAFRIYAQHDMVGKPFAPVIARSPDLGPYMVFAATAPTVSTGSGRIVWNSAAAASGKIGWVDTASGWKAFGVIDA